MRWSRRAGVLVSLVGILVGGAIAVPGPSAQVERAPAQSGSDFGRGRGVLSPQIRIFEGGASEIGVTIRDAEKGEGVIVDEVRSGRPAEQAGVRAGDVIVEFDGEKVRSARHLSRVVGETAPGRPVKMAVLREGKRVDLTVTPEERDGMLESEFRGLEESLRRLPDRQFRYEYRRPESGLHGTAPPVPPMPPAPPVPPAPPGSWLERFLSPGSGRLGVTVQNLTPQLAAYFGAKNGVLIAEVSEGSAAARAGLKAGDVVTTVNGRATHDTSDLRRALDDVGDGADVTIEIIRDRKPQTVKAKLDTAGSGRRVIQRRLPA